eukprot:TRINITY_DN9367_c0_g1_i1.p1 TRINITY_DN9367_c0_g1~~TRINITY_DN9367_c0_g1_i1.p1  ORF type:complete len:115 (-),score=26.39 TRINITY_DN9367_c0_g1_i1:47-391(-)
MAISAWNGAFFSMDVTLCKLRFQVARDRLVELQDRIDGNNPCSVFLGQIGSSNVTFQVVQNPDMREFGLVLEGPEMNASLMNPIFTNARWDGQVDTVDVNDLKNHLKEVLQRHP